MKIFFQSWGKSKARSSFSILCFSRCLAIPISLYLLRLLLVSFLLLALFPASLSILSFLSPPPFCVITVNSLNDFLPARKGVGLVPLIPLLFSFMNLCFSLPLPSFLHRISFSFRAATRRPFERAVLEQTPRSRRGRGRRRRRKRRRKATIQISR